MSSNEKPKSNSGNTNNSENTIADLKAQIAIAENENKAIKAKIVDADKENDSLVTAQQELKAEIKSLTENKPKITSGHKPGSIKYKSQVRVKPENKPEKD